MGYLYKLRLLSENAMDSDSIRYTDAINEVSITGIFHKIFGKTSKTKTIDDLEEKEATIVTANFKKAYDGWYPTITVRITSRTPKEFCDSSFNKSITIFEDFLSKLPVGSSAKITLGFLIITLPKAVLCF